MPKKLNRESWNVSFPLTRKIELKPQGGKAFKNDCRAFGGEIEQKLPADILESLRERFIQFHRVLLK